ncbi:uncharacterized protein LOC132284321 [Cornus florida]|uniref:uncharacterized protein LOC132284321 n=1 Tax=Cornus florida TaxID=4283 RepID=UPI0028A0B933|nr:uncharacterized protein LOC132284321 [Cornus florida]
MKRKKTRITDLHSDVLKHIMVFVAASLDGAANLARAKTVCKYFKELAEDTDILKAVEFDNVRPSRINRSFWQSNGLLVRCACANNLNACLMLFEYVNSLSRSLRTKINFIDSAIRDAMERLRHTCTRARMKAIRSSAEEIMLLYNATMVERAEMNELVDAYIPPGSEDC